MTGSGSSEDDEMYARRTVWARSIRSMAGELQAFQSRIARVACQMG